jgi:hypothetical protein
MAVILSASEGSLASQGVGVVRSFAGAPENRIT